MNLLRSLNAPLKVQNLEQQVNDQYKYKKRRFKRINDSLDNVKLRLRRYTHKDR